VAEGTERLQCAIGEGSSFARKCALDRVSRDGQRYLVVRHPDGGFRRFALTADGRELRTADGADRAELALAGKVMVVRVDTDAYRFALPLAGNSAR
jgi:hypothetical protein